MKSSSPSVEIHGSRIAIRRYSPPEDADRLHAAILESIEQLKPCVPWAALEPLELPDHRALIDDWIERWEGGEDFNYGVVESGMLVGGCGLHRRVGPTGLEIGYWTRASAVGRGLATDAAPCLVVGAFAMDEIELVEIRATTRDFTPPLGQP